MPAFNFVTLWKIHFIFIFTAFVQGELHSVCAKAQVRFYRNEESTSKQTDKNVEVIFNSAVVNKSHAVSNSEKDGISPHDMNWNIHGKIKVAHR